MRQQDQSAGDQSQQIQAGRDITIHGVSAAEVVQITRLEVGRAIQELSLTAESVAKSRAEAFERRVLERFEEDAELRVAFADPDFQFSLRDAGRAAVSNEDKHTEDLLVDLLANRAEQGNEARVRLATSQAIRAADKLSLDALRGLTGLWAVGALSAAGKGIHQELQSARGVAAGLVVMGLPTDNRWIEDVDALNLIRITQSGLTTRKPYAALLQELAKGDFACGIEADRFETAVEAAGEAGTQLKQLAQPHPLKPGFVALVGADADDFRSRLSPVHRENPQVAGLISANAFGTPDQAATAELENRIAADAALSAVTAWWDQVPAAQLKVTGTVIGFVNARRYLRWEGAKTIADLLVPRRLEG